MSQLTLVKFLGRSPSPLLVLREHAVDVLRALADVLEMGTGVVVQARDHHEGGPFVTGTASGNETIVTLLFDPLAHRYTVDVLSARQLAPSLAEGVLLDMLGAPGPLRVDLLERAVH